MNRAEFLKEAEKCVCQDREQSYGSPENNFKVIAEMWNLYLSNKYNIESAVTAEDVAIMMAELKIARLTTGSFKIDSYVDCIGYMACAGEIGSNRG